MTIDVDLLAYYAKVANAEVMRMAQSRPEIIDMLINTGLRNDPWIVSTIYQMARARGRGESRSLPAPVRWP